MQMPSRRCHLARASTATLEVTMPPGVYPRPTLEERFWKYVDRHGSVPEHRPELGPCWLWLKGINRDGYGRLKGESG